MMTLDQAIDTVSELSFEQQELLIEIVRKRHIAERRREIATDAKASIAEFRKGMFSPLSADAVITQLNQELKEDGYE